MTDPRDGDEMPGPTEGSAPLPPPPPPPAAAGASPPPAEGWQQPQQIVVKQGPGCLKIGLVLLFIVVVLGAVGVACLSVAGNEVVDRLEEASAEADPGDYELSQSSCTMDLLGAEASGTITNTSDKAQGFKVEVRFETVEGKLIDEDWTYTDTIAVDQSQDWEVLSFRDVPEGSELVCSEPEVSYTLFDDEGGN